MVVRCPSCGSPNAPLFEVRARNVDLVLLDMECLDCGYCWSDALEVADFEQNILAHYSFSDVMDERGSDRRE